MLTSGGAIMALSQQHPLLAVLKVMDRWEARDGSRFRLFGKEYAKFNSELDFTVTFDPDTDEFIESIVRDNKMYSSNTLDFLKKYKI